MLNSTKNVALIVGAILVLVVVVWGNYSIEGNATKVTGDVTITYTNNILYNPDPNEYNDNIPTGHILSGAGGTFERGRVDKFTKYVDGSNIEPIGSMPVTENFRYIVYFKTKDVLNAGTDADIKFWKYGNNFCLWNSMNGGSAVSNPHWKVDYVRQCTQTLQGSVAGGKTWRDQTCLQANVNAWLASTANNVICWYYG